MPTNTTGSAADTSTRIGIDIRRFSWMRRLATDYAFAFPSVAPFFSGDPAQPDAWRSTIARVQAHARRAGDIAAVVAAQQERRGAAPQARDAGRQLANARTVAILTGQQAGLFGGPLYTLLKAISALQLADAVSREHGVPAVAVFWVEAEDHDWDEIRSCTVFDAQLETRAIALPPRPAGDPVPVASVGLDESIHRAVDELAGALPATEFTSALLEQLRHAYTPGIGMADAFARWLERVLGDRGLIVYDASDVHAKPLAAQLFAQELSTPGQTSKLAASAGSELARAGYHAQVQAQSDNVALFRLDGARRTIRHQNNQLVIGDQRYDAAALAREARDNPAGFSPGVLLRPVVQDTLFPTICYVAGPNELAYLGQLRPVYEHCGVPMPLMYQRATATLADSATLRFLTKYQVPLEALQAQDEAALNALLESQLPRVVEDSFAAAAQVIDAQMTKLVDVIPAIDPTLQGAAKSTLGRMQHDLETLHGKMIQAAKRRDDTLRRQFLHARAVAFPHGHAQERTIGFVSFLNQYGPALVDRLMEELPLDMGRHWVVTI